MKKATVAALAFAMLPPSAIFSMAARAQQFSADLATSEKAGEAAGASGKLYVSGAKVRIETPEIAGGFFVVDSAGLAAYFVRPARRVFMDARQSSPLTQILVPVDPGDPCRQWQVMAQVAGAESQGGQWRCDRGGYETVDNRDAVKYQAISPQGRRITVWIDAQLKIALRIRGEDGTDVDVRNIQEGPQSAGLFDIPPGYRKFDPQALIDIIKQSDVWVDAPP